MLYRYIRRPSIQDHQENVRGGIQNKNGETTELSDEKTVGCESCQQNMCCPINALPLTITVDQLAQQLNVSRATAYELARRADFPSFRIKTGRLVVSTHGLIDWIAKQCNSKEV